MQLCLGKLVPGSCGLLVGSIPVGEYRGPGDQGKPQVALTHLAVGGQGSVPWQAESVQLLELVQTCSSWIVCLPYLVGNLPSQPLTKHKEVFKVALKYLPLFLHNMNHICFVHLEMLLRLFSKREKIVLKTNNFQTPLGGITAPRWVPSLLSR